jgi:DNA-binding CsgD family transcriptional regulator
MMERDLFSKREREVIDLLLQGKSNKQIAFLLGVSNRTIEFHLSNIYTKLGVNSRTEAIVKLSEKHLWKSTGNNLRESPVEKVIESNENRGNSVPSTWRFSMKNFFYMLGSILILIILIFGIRSLIVPDPKGIANQKTETAIPTGALAIERPTLALTQVPTQSFTPTPTSQAKIISPAEMFPHTNVIGSMVYDRERGEALLFGGQKLWECDYCNETWVWDETTWKKIEPKNTPQGRSEASLVYAANNKTVVMFGGGSGTGRENGFLNDTWLWNGLDWNKQVTDSSPGNRYRPLMVYDFARKKTVLYGGEQAQGRALIPLYDTWTWNGMDWKEQKTVSNPGVAFRLAAGMVYDTVHQIIVLWNGSTWTWDGTNWNKQNPVHNPPLYMTGIVMGYDEEHEQTILVGSIIGSGSGQAKTETWIWDGQDWKLATGDLPAGSGENLIYDSRQKVLILFALSGDKFAGITRTLLYWTGSNWVEVNQSSANPIGERPTSHP